MISRPRLYSPLSPLRARAREGQAVVCPLLRGSSPTRWVAPKQHWGPAFTLLCHPYARAREGQAVVCPLLRGSSPTRWVAPKQHWGLGRAFSPAFRAGGIPLGAGVPKNLARRSFGLLVSAARCCSRRSGRLGGAVAAGRRRCRLRIEI